MIIPFSNLSYQSKVIQQELANKWERIISDGDFILGQEVEIFEKRYSNFVGSKYCVGVANGTDAIELSLRAVDIKAGDEVLVPTNSFVATAIAVVRIGAIPVFIDCDDYYLMDISQIEQKITKKTRAIVPVHLYGQCVQVHEIRKVLNGKDIYIVEDAAQAQGATNQGIRAGNLGDVSATSFYPGKNLGAFGDAGAITTNSEEIYKKLIKLRNYGSEIKYQHPVLGFNSRLDTLQAAVLNCKLDYLVNWNNERSEIAGRYLKELNSIKNLVVPSTFPENKHVWHLFVVKVTNRSQFVEKLKMSGISTVIHYPTPIHKHKAFGSYSFKNKELVKAEKFADEIISLPMYPGMQEEQVNYVIEKTREALHGNR
jgi:dTDP-4-amino-4,6-dideoxygalactose transaminase